MPKMSSAQLLMQCLPSPVHMLLRFDALLISAMLIPSVCDIFLEHEVLSRHTAAMRCLY
jgi:hypothetical protein